MKLVAICLTLTAVLPLVVSTTLPAQAQAPESPAAAQQNPVPNSPVVPRPSPTSQPAPAPPPAASQVSTQEFYFNGGSFYDFIEKLRATYGTNALELLDVPEEGLPSRIPKMRFPMKYTNIRSAFILYNSTSEAGDWYLGRWIYFPANNNDDQPLRTLVFFPPKLANPANTGGIAVRAFNIASIKPAQRTQLQEIVEMEVNRLREEILSGRFTTQDPANVSGRISVHEGSKLLVATGGKTYVELVASLVEALEKTPKPF